MKTLRPNLNYRQILIFLSAAACFTLCMKPANSRAADPGVSPPAASPAAESGDRYGPFGLFDSRSQYGKGAFPEPFIVDDSDLEVNEVRLDWLHTEARGQGSDFVTGEVEKGFGLLTLEVEVHYERDTTRSFDFGTGHSDFDRQQGFANTDLVARFPIYQYVSQDEFIDTTFGLGIEVGVPTNSPVSKNTEIVPKFFNDTRIGDHFTLQTIVGVSFLRGGGEEGGSDTFEYGLVFGWTVPHSELPIPYVQQMVPVFELSGATSLNKGEAGQDALLGNAAVRFNMNAIGRIQPRLGVGYVFPMDKGGKDQLRWGIVTSLVFEF